MGLCARSTCTTRPNLTYNIFRWYRAGWGRYTQADPIGLMAGVNLFAYVYDNPLATADPTGLCAKNPGLADCKMPGSGCCTAACIDDLRYSLCLDKKVKPGLTMASTLLSAMTGAGIGMMLGPKGSLIGGVCGLVIGYSMGNSWYYGYEDMFQKAGLWGAFRKCMNDCGQQCDGFSNKPCAVKQLFEQVYGEAKK